MSIVDSRLKRHLATALVIKLVLLALLWWFFGRNGQVAVDTRQTAAHLAGVSSGPGVKP